ncbi:hypothetical protein L0Y65_05490 [Candidatus Micrarchaeota archaeon]|nr:hypothetical protein [Candidatus Micrarchaeota archaeon]
MESSQPAMAKFRNPSTFTYLFRNSSIHSAYARKIAAAFKPEPEKPLNLLYVGAGPFEPFYSAALLAPIPIKMTVIDISPAITSSLEGIKSGKPLPLADAARLCCNINDDGKPRRNSDLTDERHIERAIEEGRRFGLRPDDFLSSDRGSFVINPDVLMHGNRMDVLTADIFEYAKGHAAAPFDAIFMCNVFVNLKKTEPKDRLASLFSDLSGMLAASGVFALVETPASIHGPENLSAFLHSGGFSVAAISLDNIVASGGIRGGYNVLAQPRLSAPMRLELGESVSAHPLFQGITSQILLPHDELPDFLGKTDTLLLSCGRCAGNPGYALYTADSKELAGRVTSSRVSFDFL